MYAIRSYYGPVGAMYGAAVFASQVIAGSLAAGVGGGAIAGWLNSEALNVPTDLLKDIKESIHPGTSAIVAVVEDEWVEEVEAILESGSQMMHHYQFSDSVVEKFEEDWDKFENEQNVTK